jgi:MFS family permease
MSNLFSLERIIAPPGFNRWRVPPASIAIHVCIGSIYAWSVFNPALIKAEGVVASAADDWTLSQVVRTFTVVNFLPGLAAALAGTWLARVGPRVFGTLAAFCWGGGLLLGGLAVELHSLWLLYLGYGVLGGIGVGLGYIAPVSALIRWFPDRRGLAAGMAIMGFGGGAIIATPLGERLMTQFYQAPDYLGTEEATPLVTEAGRRYAQLDGRRHEVVVVSAGEIDKMPVKGAPGVYVVGTGRTGVAQTLYLLGAVYSLVMLAAAFSYRVPAPDWRPEGWSPPDPQATSQKLISRHDVDVNQALKTPQFYLLWIVLCLNTTAGISVLSVAKTLVIEVFGNSLAQIAWADFAKTYVMLTGIFNMLGRFFWASASDLIGRRRTFSVFFVLAIALYLSIPFIAGQVSEAPSLAWLVAFCAATLTTLTIYGGGFATIPAYIADLFGARFVGGIHGRILTAWSVAAAVGPEVMTALRDRSLAASMADLARGVDPAAFAAKFGAPLADLDLLIANKTVTVAKLLELAPSGTVDPTGHAYNSTMYLMATLLAIALVANTLVRPVNPKHHLKGS